MILSGKKIIDEVRNGNILITPFNKSQVNPNSYNLRLGNKLLVYDEYILDMKKNNRYHTIEIPEDGFVMKPGKLYLGQTLEHTYTDKYVPMLEGRSSVGRLGVCIHATAGFGDVGFNGFWTLELFCIQPVKIYAGTEICQIYYHTIDGDYNLYNNGKYSNNNGIQASKLYEDFAISGMK